MALTPQQIQQYQSQLSQLDALREQYRPRTGREVLADTGVAALQGAVQLGQAAYGAGNLATLGALDRAVGLSENFDRTYGILQGMRSAPLQRDQAAAQEAFDRSTWEGIKAYGTNPTLLGDLAVSTLPSLLPAGAAAQFAGRTAAAANTAAGLTRAQQAARTADIAKRSTNAAIRAAALQSGGAVNVDAINAIREAGGTDTEGQIGGLIAAPIAGLATMGAARLTGAGALEAAVARRLAGLEAGTAGGGAGAVRGLFTGAAKESAEEALQNPAELIATNLVTPGTPLMEGTAQASALGALAGGLMGGPLGAFHGVRRPSDLRNEVNPELQRAAAAVGQAGKGALESEGPLPTADVTEAEEIDLGAAPMPQLTPEEQLMAELYEEGLDTRGDLPTMGVADAESALTREELDALALIRADGAAAREAAAIPQMEVDDGTIPPLPDVEEGFGETLPASARAARGLDLLGDPTELAGLARAQAALRDEPEDVAPEVSPRQQALPFEDPTPLQRRINEQLGLGRPVSPINEQTSVMPVDMFGDRLPTPAPVEEAAPQDEAAPTGASAQRTLGLGGIPASAVKGWREFFAKNLRLTPAQMTGKDWQAFAEAAVEAGVDPESPAAATFLQTLADELAPLPGEKGSAFAEKVAGKYASPIEEIDAGAVPTPGGEEIDLAATPLPEATPEDRLANQLEALAARYAGRDTLPTPAVEELDTRGMTVAERALVEAARGRPTESPAKKPLPLADVVEGLPTMGVDEILHQPMVEEIEGTSGTVKGWRQFFAKKFKMSPQKMAGNEWKRFANAAEAAGISPESEHAPAFLRTMAQEIAPRETGAATSDFGAALGMTYAPPLDKPEAKPKKPTKAEDKKAAAVRVAADNAPKEVKKQAKVAAKPAVKQAEAVAAETQVQEQVEAEAVAAERAEVEAAGAAVAATEAGDVAPPLSAKEKAATKRMSKKIAKAKGDLGGTVDPDTDTQNAVMNLLDDADSAAKLTGQWETIARTPEFQALPDEHQQRAEKYFKDLHKAMETGRFKMREDAATATDGEFKPREAISIEDFGTMLRLFNTTRGNVAEVQGHTTVEAFRETTGHAAPNNVMGVYLPDGSLHVIRENIKDRKEMASTLLHERGHAGLAGVLGNRLGAVTNRMWANAKMRDRIKAKMKTEGLSRAVAAEEVMVDMLAVGEKLAPDVWGKIKSGVRQTAAKLLGVGDLSMPDTAIDALMQDIARYIRTGKPNATSRLVDDAAWATLDEYLGAPDMVTEDARYSRVMEDLKAATEEVFGRDATMGDVENAAAANKPLVTRAKELISNLKGVGRSGYLQALDFMPLDQIASFYEKLFAVPGSEGRPGYNPLTELSEAKSRKSATQSIILTKENDLVYEGPDGPETRKKVGVMQHANRWAKLAGKKGRREFHALNATLQFGTHYKLWPDRSFEQQSKLDYESAGFNEAERREAHVQMQRMWQVMGEEGRAMFKDTQAIYRNLWDTRYDALLTEYKKLAGDDSEAVKRLQESVDSALQRVRQGPYSPTTRFGNHFVTIRDKDGKAVYFAGYDTEFEAAAAEASVWDSLTDEQRDGGDWSVQRSARAEFYSSNDGINHQLMQRMERRAEEALPGNRTPGDPDLAAIRADMKQALVELYLQSQPDHSIMIHANARKGVAGFSLDALRGYSDYTLKAARNIASIRHDGDIGRHLLGMDEAVREARGASNRTDVTKMQYVVNAVRGQHAAARDATFSSAASMIGQAGFTWYMTSPSQMAVNVMQTAMVAFPRLGGRYGTGNAIKALGSAMNTYFASGRDMMGENSTLDPTTKNILQRMNEAGVFDFTYAHSLNDLAVGDHTAMSARRRAAMEAMSFFMHKSEVFNRQVTALAAIQLEAQRLQKEGADPDAFTPEQLQRMEVAARKSVKDSHFVYDRFNHPTVMQGPWRKLVFQFQTYRLNMLAMLARDIRDARYDPELRAEATKTLGLLLGTQVAFTGLVGTVLSPIVFAIADMVRDDDELLDSRTATSLALPDFLAHGFMAGLLNIDPSRLDTGSLLPGLGDRAWAPKDASARDTWMYYLSRNLGPWVGLFTDAAEGVEAVWNGDGKKALSKLLPKPFSDTINALYYEAGAVKDAQQIAYFTPNPWDTALRATGLKSWSRREADNLRGASYQAHKAAETRRSKYIGQYVLAQAQGDEAGMQEARARMERWTEKHPDLPIKWSSVRSATKTRARKERMAEETGIPTAQPLPPSVRASLNLSE